MTEKKEKPIKSLSKSPRLSLKFRRKPKSDTLAVVEDTITISVNNNNKVLKPTNLDQFTDNTTSQKIDSTQDIQNKLKLLEQFSHKKVFESYAELQKATHSDLKKENNISYDNVHTEVSKDVHDSHDNSSILKGSDQSNDTTNLTKENPNNQNDSSEDIGNKLLERQEVLDKANKSKPLKPHNEDAIVSLEQNTEEKKVNKKGQASKRFQKSNVYKLLSNEEPGLDSNVNNRSNIRRKSLNKSSVKIYREITIPEKIAVSDFSHKLSEKVGTVIKELMKLGMMSRINDIIDGDTAELVGSALGHKVTVTKSVGVGDILSTKLETDISKLETRPPIVTIMGHVDHGKTTLLDALRNTDIVNKEAGGITQHIGAYQVTLASGQKITFLDTPGHEAFSSMRARGSQVTDIVILVVAGDDGIKAQTVEAISHVKSANVPIIVAVNKMDRDGANLEKVKNSLLAHDLIAEDLGGEVMIVPVSALKMHNLDKLEESILLLADLLDLKANPNHNVASGIVIEAKLDSYKGVITTLLVEQGTLKKGDIVVVGESYGKIKLMQDDSGNVINAARPAMPAQILGLNKVPDAGDRFIRVANERKAKEIVAQGKEEKDVSIVSSRKVGNLKDLFSKTDSEKRILSVIVKADVHGSVEAIKHSINNIGNEKISTTIAHSAVGAITESDIMLAEATKSIILGFNVRAIGKASLEAEKLGIDIRCYSVIYHLIDDIKSLMSGMLDPVIHEKLTGMAEVRELFDISKIGKVAGSFITKGVVKKNSKAKVIRAGVVMFEGRIQTLKRFKEDVREAKENYECGITLENYSNLSVGDIIESYEIEEIKQTL